MLDFVYMYSDIHNIEVTSPMKNACIGGRASVGRSKSLIHITQGHLRPVR